MIKRLNGCTQRKKSDKIRKEKGNYERKMEDMRR